MRTAPLAILLLAGMACSASTDRAAYATHDTGTTSFRNDSETTAWLEGCSAYSFERLAGPIEPGTGTPERWQNEGPAVVCFWEGLARAVGPAKSLTLDLIVPGEPGIWRLRYQTALGCDPERPLTQADCERMGPIYTPVFTVEARCAPEACGPPLGLANILCPDRESLAGPTGRCLLDIESDLCGWEIAECPAGPR